MGLTAEQRKKVDEVLGPLEAEAKRTDPIDENACIAAFAAAYAALKLKQPEFVFCTSPGDAFQRLESMVPDASKFADVVGAEVFFCRDEYNDIVFAQDMQSHPSFRDLDKRAEKALGAYRDLANAADDPLEKAATRRGTMLYNGSNSFWRYAGHCGHIEGLQTLGLVKLPESYTLGRIAMASCNQIFAYEKYCFISDRPQGYTHPQISKDGPRDRITAQWRDGFAYEVELWF